MLKSWANSKKSYICALKNGEIAHPPSQSYGGKTHLRIASVDLSWFDKHNGEIAHPPLQSYGGKTHLRIASVDLSWFDKHNGEIAQLVRA